MHKSGRADPARPAGDKNKRDKGALSALLLDYADILISLGKAFQGIGAYALKLGDLGHVDIPAVFLEYLDGHILVILLQLCNQFLNSHYVTPFY